VRIWGTGIVLAALAGVMAHALMAQGQVRAGKVDQALSEETRKYDDARLRVAQLESPAEIVQRATRLGFVPGGARRTVAVANTPSTADTAPASATAADQVAKRMTDQQP